MTDTAADARRAAIDALGIEYSAKFVPASLTDRPDQINWSISIGRNGRPPLVVHYSQGVGHIPNFPHSRRTVYEATKQDAIKQLGVEQCKYATRFFTDGVTPARTANLSPPTLEDVLWCLILDADCLDSGGFENWCSDYGYDTDSRKAEKTYQECVDQSLKFVSMIGQTALAELRELFADY